MTVFSHPFPIAPMLIAMQLEAMFWALAEDPEFCRIFIEAYDDAL